MLDTTKDLEQVYLNKLEATRGKLQPTAKMLIVVSTQDLEDYSNQLEVTNQITPVN